MSEKLNPVKPILVVDDEEAILLAIDTTLQIAGFNNVLTCSDGQKARELLARQEVEVVFLDLSMPHMDGTELLEIISSEYPAVPVIIVTGAVDVETAVGCMRSGAFDYITKPVEEERLVTSLQRALAFVELKRENFALKQHILSDTLENPEAFAGIITANKKMMSLFQYIESIAPTSQPVLIRGETGVGKELIAGTLHTLSGRKGRFVAVNVAGLEDNVFSDTLFGHVRGAFTGADRNRSGLIETAAGGTLFLDEIGDLSPASQVKLLRLVQEGEYFPLGLDEARKSDARIVASTNLDLWKLQEKGDFRKDLNYRLRTHRIFLPPLSERKGDIHLLLRHFLEKAAHTLEVDTPRVPDELITLLRNYSFPGNVRELQTLVFDAVSRHKSGTLSMAAFRDHIRQHRERRSAGNATTPPATLPEHDQIAFGDTLPTIQDAVRLLTHEAMRRSDGNQTIAAGMLGITQQALSKRLKKMTGE